MLSMFWKSIQIFKSGVEFRAQSEMDRGSFFGTPKWVGLGEK